MNYSSSLNTHSNLSRLRRVSIFVASAFFAIFTACGGDGPAPTPTPLPSGTSVQVNLGDGPADWMLGFSMNISSMSLTTSSGPVNITSGSTAEMIHRLGTMEPLAMVSVPKGTYTGANVTIASCNVTYYDQLGAMKQQTIQGPISASIPFSSAVTVGTTPLAFNFDFDLDRSVTMDDSGVLHLNPQFHASFGTQGAGNGNGAHNGGMQQMMGVVNVISSNSFSITSLQATNTFTFMVNSQTQFMGMVNAMNQLRAGMGVLVTAALQPDGTLLATRVRPKMNAGGIMGGGIITNVVGQPATQLTIVMQNGAGASVMTSYLSQILTVNLTPETEYEIDSDRVDLTNLDFAPVFDASHIVKGQSVLPISTDDGLAVSGISGTAGTMTATVVRQQEQGFRGTTTTDIIPGGSGYFDLQLPAGCAFLTLTGGANPPNGTIRVRQQPSTNVEDATAIPAGATLRVHGLLYNNGGVWTLVASTIAAS